MNLFSLPLAPLFALFALDAAPVPVPPPAVAPAIPIAGDEPALAVRWHADGLRFELSGEGKFFGGVLISLRPGLRDHLVGLPPLLGDHAVLGAGFADGMLAFDVAAKRVPLGIDLYAQGVIASAAGIRATAVHGFGRSAPDRTQ
ncbi:MAG: hypothetical protein U1E73_03760 [Planctomycetota bacterium]